MRWSAAILIGSVLLAAGCSPPEPDLSAVVDGRDRGNPAEAEDSSEFDFGAVVARDQTLRHEFPSSNREDRPLRILGAKANTPCCSSVGKLPESIPQGGVATIPVFLKAGHIAERKRVTFDIATDSKSEPVRTLTLAAQFFPDWEVEEIGVSPDSSSIGQLLKRRLKIVCHRKGGEGRKLPPGAITSPNLQIGPILEESEFEGSNGIIEATREFEVTLAGQPEPGPQLGSMAFRWPDGTMKSHEIRWEIKPSLQLFPPAFVLPSSDKASSITVVIKSDRLPFRVVAVSDPLLTGQPILPSEAQKAHSIRLDLDSTRSAPGGKNEIKIVTEHPDQPALSLNVLIMPREKGGSE